MTLQLGVLRDALLEAKASPDKANAAAEAVGGFEVRLTRLTTGSQFMMALVLVLLAGQAAVLIEVGKLSGTLTASIEKSAEINVSTNAKLTSLDTQQQGTAVKLAEIETKLNDISAQIAHLKP